MSSTNTGALRVLVVDDHPIVRMGLAELISAAPGMSVCGQAASSMEAMSLLAKQHFDVAIVDLTLGAEDGLDLVSAIAVIHPTVRTLVLSVHDERLYADRALKTGAAGYVMKNKGIAELLGAIARVGQGKTALSDEAAEQVLSRLAGRPGQPGSSPLDRLTDRERHVLTLVGRGLGTRDIAQQVALPVKTVESDYARVKKKLGLRSGRDLKRFAVTWVEGYLH